MNRVPAQSLAFPYPLPGSVVSVPFFLVYRHLGIVSDRWHGGKPMVISNSSRAGGAREEPWDVFAAGRPVTVEKSDSSMSSFETISQARSRIGTGYDVLKWNCEHFVRFAQGQTPSSPQTVVTLAVAALGWMLIAKQG